MLGARIAIFGAGKIKSLDDSANIPRKQLGILAAIVFRHGLCVVIRW
jgi:hypothetical protein